MIQGPVAILSGKGGAGKTTLAVRLAQAAAREGEVLLVDADAEEPNAALLLSLSGRRMQPILASVASVDPSLCRACGRCVDACAFNAITWKRPAVSISASLCHGCGLCARLCPAQAISNTARPIGTLTSADAGPGLALLESRLEVGQPRATEAIRTAMELAAKDTRTVLVDGPPGCACSAMMVVRHARFCLLVAQPTPMGVHDLALALEMAQRASVPTGIVINRSTARGDALVRDLARARNVAILGTVPEDAAIANPSRNLEATGREALFLGIWQSIRKACA